MSTDTPVTADIHRTALGIIAAREARIASLEAALVDLLDRRRVAIEVTRIACTSIEDYQASLAAVRDALGEAP